MSVCEPHAACRWPQLETPSVPRPPGPQNGMRTREPDRMCQCGGTASQSSQNHQPAPQTRRTGSVARGSTLRALHGRTAERPAQSCHGGTRAARRPRRPLMMPPQPPPLRSVRLYAGQVSWKCWDMAVDEWGAAGARACRLSARPWLPGLGFEQ